MSRRNSIHETDLDAAVREGRIPEAPRADQVALLVARSPPPPVEDTPVPSASPVPETPRPPATITISQEALEALLTLRVQEAQGSPRPAYEAKIHWADLAPFAYGEKLDAWLVAVESLFKANRVPEKHWASRLLSCPGLPQQAKTLFADCADYPELRRLLLKEYGIPDPVGHARAAIWDYKGTDRDVVRLKLDELLNLHNRACRDVGLPEWSRMDLIQPFIRAFPARIQEALRGSLGAAMNAADPVRYLYDAIAVVSTVAAAPAPSLVAPVADSSPAAPAAPTSEADLRRLISEVLARDSRGPSKRARRSCHNCGGSCQSRDQCPAQGKECHKCGRKNHWASVCRSKSSGKPDFPRGPV